MAEDVTTSISSKKKIPLSLSCSHESFNEENGFEEPTESVHSDPAATMTDATMRDTLEP